MTLNGKTVLVTAGAKHLGAHIVEAFARRGANVAINYRSAPEDARRLAEQITSSHGGTHMVVRADVARSDEVAEMESAVAAELGPVSVLVNNAGPFSKTPFLEMGEEEWDDVIDSNLKAAYLCSAAVAPAMRHGGWGRIVNVSAVSAYVRNRSIYGLSKASLHTLTESLALELGPEITVNGVAPGQISESLEEMSGIDPGWADTVAAATPLGRLVTRTEVADLIALMCTEPFDMVTGVVIPVDGGLRLPRF